MNEARLLEVIEAYGADPQAWPMDERAQALALVPSSVKAQALLREAAALDQLLTAPGAQDLGTLKARILARVEARQATWPVRLAQLLGHAGAKTPQALWRPAAIMVASAAMGLVVGVVTLEAPTQGTNDALSDLVDEAFG